MADSKHIKGVVTTRRDIAPDLWAVRIRPEEKIPFVPGQYVTIALHTGGERMVERPYSLVSAPHEPELEFFLERVEVGELTPHLFKIPEGGEVFMRRSAKGRFFFDEKSGHTNHLMVATATGAAPYISMLRHHAARLKEGGAFGHRVIVLQGASISEELGYCEELTGWARELEWLDYIPTISRTWMEPGWSGEKGRVEDVTRKYLDAAGFTAADTTAYVCGNPDMIENVKGVLKRVGFAKEFVKEEVYWIPEKGS